MYIIKRFFCKNDSNCYIEYYFSLLIINELTSINISVYIYAIAGQGFLATASGHGWACNNFDSATNTLVMVALKIISSMWDIIQPHRGIIISFNLLHTSFKIQCPLIINRILYRGLMMIVIAVVTSEIFEADTF